MGFSEAGGKDKMTYSLLPHVRSSSMPPSYKDTGQEPLGLSHDISGD